VEPPRWLVDEMLGRLARYLRFVGCDTVYARDATDDELLSRAAREGRVLLTRDRQLSRRCRSSFRVESAQLGEQWRAVRAAWPSVPSEPSFARCTLCNGRLEVRPSGGATEPHLPPSVREGTTPLYACRECGHLYWDGSHTAKIRERLASWEGRPAP
jgi:uncharacterized protein